MAHKSLQNYLQLLKMNQQEVSKRALENNGLGLEGWNSMSQSSFREQYRAGKMPIKLAKNYNITAADHAAMLASVPEYDRQNKIIELINSGIDMDQIQRALTQSVKRASRTTKEPTLPKSYEDMTEGEKAVAEYDLQRKLERRAAAKGKRGFEVQLTNEERAKYEKEGNLRTREEIERERIYGRK